MSKKKRKITVKNIIGDNGYGGKIGNKKEKKGKRKKNGKL